jgi:hypothetical protein
MADYRIHNRDCGWMINSKPSRDIQLVQDSLFLLVILVPLTGWENAPLLEQKIQLVEGVEMK